ncbi:stalk domain-containing protein [Anaerobacillus alkaliphilus]|nr:stalk domain-containing protein [Anaerobacillus alkaliphilus]
MRSIIKSTWMAIVFTLVFGLIFSNQAGAKNTSFHYVALGDSLTVGLEPQQYWDANAPVFGFVDRVYEQALFYGKTNVKNYGVNGLTSTGLKNILVTMDQGSAAAKADIQETLRDPRIDQLLKSTNSLKADIVKADLITITIGGNDFGARTYIDIRDLNEQEVQIFLDEKISVYQENIKETLNVIYRLNPEVTVVIADQYNPFPRVNQDMYKKLTLLSTQFTKVLEGISAQYKKDGYELILAPVAKSFINREISYTHILRADIHPNQKGYDVMAKVISELLWGVYHEAPPSEKEITIYVKGKELVTPFDPVISNGSTFVPIREYAESLGATVAWQGATQSAVVKLDQEVITFTVGSDFISVGNERVALNDKVQLINGKVYVPLRAIAEGLKFDVTYSKATKRAFIN